MIHFSLRVQIRKKNLLCKSSDRKKQMSNGTKQVVTMFKRIVQYNYGCTYLFRNRRSTYNCIYKLHCLYFVEKWYAMFLQGLKIPWALNGRVLSPSEKSMGIACILFSSGKACQRVMSRFLTIQDSSHPIFNKCFLNV